MRVLGWLLLVDTVRLVDFEGRVFGVGLAVLVLEGVVLLSLVVFLLLSWLLVFVCFSWVLTVHSNSFNILEILLIF